MDVLDDRGKRIRIRVRLDTVTEVEDMSGMSRVVRENRIRGGESRVDVTEYGRRVHVSLHDEIVAESTTCVADRRTPIQADHVTSRFVDRLKEMIATNTEVNACDVWEPIV